MNKEMYHYNQIDLKMEVVHIMVFKEYTYVASCIKSYFCESQDVRLVQVIYV